MNDHDDYDRDHSFRPYRIELRGSHEEKIFLTDSEIREIEEEEKDNDDENNA